MHGLLTSRHRSFYIAVGLGVVAFAVTFLLEQGMALAVGCNVFFLTYLGLTAAVSRKADRAVPARARRGGG